MVLYVAVSPSDYYNYGYRNARNTHFSFNLNEIDPRTGKETGDSIYGYAQKDLFRQYFEGLNRQMETDGASVVSTVVVTVLPGRYTGRSADHVEVLDARLGRFPDFDTSKVDVSRFDPNLVKLKKNTTSTCEKMFAQWHSRKILVKEINGAIAFVSAKSGVRREPLTPVQEKAALNSLEPREKFLAMCETEINAAVSPCSRFEIGTSEMGECIGSNAGILLFAFPASYCKAQCVDEGVKALCEVVEVAQRTRAERYLGISD